MLPGTATRVSDVFPLTKVINLADRPDRLREITAQLHKLGMAFAPGKVEVHAATRPTSAAGFPGIGAHGCFLSHLGVLREARDRGVGRVLILEDDLEVSPAQVEALGRLLPQIAGQPWQILHLGHAQPSATPLSQAHLAVCTTEVYAAHLYAIDASIFEPLIAYLEGCLTRPEGDLIGGPMHYDGALTMFRKHHPGTVTLIAEPSLAGQRSSRSDITPNRLDRLPGLRQALAAGRALRRTFR
jgi:GR25 family glycosyltransferase involved in LPS biosynthesis